MLLHVGLDNPVAMVSVLQIRKQKPREGRSLPEDTQPIRKPPGLEARLVWKGLTPGHGLQGRGPQGLPGESGWAKNDFGWRARGGPAFRGQTAGSPSSRLQGEEGLGGAVSGPAGFPACLGTVRRPRHCCPWAAVAFGEDFLADQQEDSARTSLRGLQSGWSEGGEAGVVLALASYHPSLPSFHFSLPPFHPSTHPSIHLSIRLSVILPLL